MRVRSHTHVSKSSVKGLALSLIRGWAERLLMGGVDVDCSTAAAGSAPTSKAKAPLTRTGPSRNQRGVSSPRPLAKALYGLSP